MAATVDVLNPLEYPEWDKLLIEANDHSSFHTSLWARVLHDTYNYRPCYLAMIHDRKLTALLPVMEVKSALTGRRGVSLPFTDYCDPIISDHSNADGVWECLMAYGERERWKYVEFRGGEDFLGEAPYSAFYYRHVLKLTGDIDAIYAQLKSSVKRNVKKALREGVTVSQSSTLDAVETFFRLHCLTRKKHGLPPQPVQFFHRIYDHIISRGRGQVGLVWHQGKAIAGAVYLHFGNEAVYKFGASDSRYLHLRPNDLLMWETIASYCRNGYDHFCFGRTDPDNEGLRQFKRGWGAEEKVVRYYTYDIAKKEFRSKTARSFSFARMIFRKMPTDLSRLVGKILYPHVG